MLVLGLHKSLPFPNSSFCVGTAHSTWLVTNYNHILHDSNYLYRNLFLYTRSKHYTIHFISNV